jgi:hypothetical protein
LAKKANELLTFVDAPAKWGIRLPLRDFKEISNFNTTIGGNDEIYTDFVSLKILNGLLTITNTFFLLLNCFAEMTSWSKKIRSCMPPGN